MQFGGIVTVFVWTLGDYVTHATKCQQILHLTSVRKREIFFSWKNLLNNIDWLAVMLFGMNPCTLVPCAMCMLNWILDVMVCKALTSTLIATSFQNFIPLKYNEIYLYERHFYCVRRRTLTIWVLREIPRVLLWMPRDCTILTSWRI